MNRFLLLALSLLALSGTGTAHAESETRWMKVLLDGRKVGQVESLRQIDGDRVVSTERMTLSVERAGVSLPVGSEETSIESIDGRPLGFVSRTSMSGLDSVVEGQLGADGQWDVVLRAGKSEQKRRIAWPAGAVLAEGARLAEVQHGLAPGTQYRVLSFQPSGLMAITVDVSVEGSERIMLEDGSQDLVRVDQVAQLPGAPLRMSAWVDREHQVQRATLPLMGMAFEMLACSEACAKAPNQAADVLDRAMVAAPRALSVEERRGSLVFGLSIRGDEALSIPSVGEQHGARANGGWQVLVEAGGRSAETTRPVAADVASNRWLNHDDPAVLALAKRAAGPSPPRDRAKLMLQLEGFVRSYIDNKSMRVGYASAAETVASREGDCTEHAVLLAALGRALGVPTRVVNGLAYAGAFAGREQVFVPHAWVQAWDGSRWRSYDAALAGFDASHLALSVGDGDAAGFYAGVALLGNVAIDSIKAPAEIDAE
jgi:hypothetical protein